MSCSGRLLYLIALNFITAKKTHTDLMNFAIYRFFFYSFLYLHCNWRFTNAYALGSTSLPFQCNTDQAEFVSSLKENRWSCWCYWTLTQLENVRIHIGAPRGFDSFRMTQKKVHRLTEGGRCRRTCSCVRTLLCFVSTCAGKWSCSQARQITHHTVLTGLIYMACVRHEASHFEEVFRKRRGFCQTVLL